MKPNKRTVHYLILFLIPVLISCGERKKQPDNSHKPSIPSEASLFPLLNDSLSGLKREKLNTAFVTGLEQDLDSLRLALCLDGSIRALSIQWVDLNTGLGFQLDSTTRYVPASLLKIPILIACFKLEEEKGNILNQMLVPGQADPGLIDKNLEENESWTFESGKAYPVSELMQIMVSHSDNNATLALLQFLEQRDPYLLVRVENDLKASLPPTSNNLEDIVRIGHFAAMMEALYQGSYLNPDHSNRALQMLSRSRYGQGFRKSIPAGISMAHKFGVRFNVSEMNPEFPVQLHQVAIVYHPRHPFLLSVMSKGNDINMLRSALQQCARLCYEKVNSSH